METPTWRVGLRATSQNILRNHVGTAENDAAINLVVVRNTFCQTWVVDKHTLFEGRVTLTKLVLGSSQ